MILKVRIDDQDVSLEIPKDMLEEAEDIFIKMDQDMDQGWQMGRDWEETPNTQAKCKIVADRMLSAANLTERLADQVLGPPDRRISAPHYSPRAPPAWGFSTA